MMKKIWTLLAMGAFVAGGAAGADVRVVRAEGVAEGVAASVEASIDKNASVGTEVVQGGARVEGESAEDFARREGARTDGGVSLVLVDWEDEEIGGLSRPEEGFALLNVARLAGEEPVPGDVLARRADREALRAHAHLMGVPPCPFPLCVLTRCGSVEALDSMSMNYCPPCWEKMREVQAAKGFDVRPVARSAKEKED